jgi:hypothetical protein
LGFWGVTHQSIEKVNPSPNPGILERKLACLLLNLRRKDEEENVSYISDRGTHFMQLDYRKNM